MEFVVLMVCIGWGVYIWLRFHDLYGSHQKKSLVSGRDYDQGKLHGLREDWSEDSYVISSYYYGTQTGCITFPPVSNQDREEFSRETMGKLHVKHYKFSDNRILSLWTLQGQIECSFIDNLPFGPCRVYYSNGKLHSFMNFFDGKVSGRCKTWFLSGRHRSHESYRDGLLHGRCKYWHSNGKLRRLCTYTRGQLSHQVQVWNREGEIKFTRFYPKLRG